MPWLLPPRRRLHLLVMEHVLLAGQYVRVAHDDDRLLGFAAVDGDWPTQLYVELDHQGRGVGRALLDDAER